MREPTYLSPTSMSKWAEAPQEYYKRYLSDVSDEKEPQTQPMSVGSAFDAFVKSTLYEGLFGSPSAPGNDPRFARDAIFEDQVAPHNRDWARVAGEWCLSQYRQLGALDGLLVDLGRSKGPPKFEMDVRGSVSYGRDGIIRSVPFRVKPDLHFVNEHGAFVILDWKVNGYCSASGQSPTKGFVRARRRGKMPWVHDDCVQGTHKGISINKLTLEKFNAEWATQCSVGAWVCGMEVGGEFIAIIHQLACSPQAGSQPKVTVAEHAGIVSPAFQEVVHEGAVKMWAAISECVHRDGCTNLVAGGCTCGAPRHVFRHMTLDESIKTCAILDKRHEITRGLLSPALEDLE